MPDKVLWETWSLVVGLYPAVIWTHVVPVHIDHRPKGQREIKGAAVLRGEELFPSQYNTHR